MAANAFRGWRSRRSNSLICHPDSLFDRSPYFRQNPSQVLCECVEWCFKAVIRQSGEHLDLRWQQLYRASPHKVLSYLFPTIIRRLFSLRVHLKNSVCLCNEKDINAHKKKDGGPRTFGEFYLIKPKSVRRWKFMFKGQIWIQPAEAGPRLWAAQEINQGNGVFRCAYITSNLSFVHM